MSDSLRHVAIIMDGNGRWAVKQGKPRTYGHTVGAANIEVVAEAAKDMGVEYLTVYAFSTENWKRQETEVNAIMTIISDYLDRLKMLAEEKNLRLRVIGERGRIDPALREKIIAMEEYTSQFTGFTLIIAFDYGFRNEMCRAVKKIMDDAALGKVDPSDIDEDFISGYLDTAGIPDPDLLIRTGGESRLSNYLMWQLSYAELYFTDVAWPDFGREELAKALEYYKGRDRRYGNA